MAVRSVHWLHDIFAWGSHSRVTGQLAIGHADSLVEGSSPSSIKHTQRPSKASPQLIKLSRRIPKYGSCLRLGSRFWPPWNACWWPRVPVSDFKMCLPIAGKRSRTEQALWLGGLAVPARHHSQLVTNTTNTIHSCFTLSRRCLTAKSAAACHTTQ